MLNFRLLQIRNRVAFLAKKQKRFFLYNFIFTVANPRRVPDGWAYKPPEDLTSGKIKIVQSKSCLPKPAKPQA